MHVGPSCSVCMQLAVGGPNVNNWLVWDGVSPLETPRGVEADIREPDCSQVC